MQRRAHRDETSMAAVQGAQPEKLRRARMFRQSPTSAEAALWGDLRRRAVGGFRFRRQHIIAGYIVDFYCPGLRLAIEVDGGVHDTQRELDERRTRHLAQLGVTVLRVPNARVFSEPDAVVGHILEACERLQASLAVATKSP